SGVGAANYVAASAPLSYRVNFENIAGATLAARTVLVDVPLDTTLVSAAESSLQSLVVGSTPMHIIGSSGLEFFGEGPAPSDARMGIPISGDLIQGGTVLRITYTTIDAATGMPPSDSLAGFLPRNASPPEGEGYVLFRLGRRRAQTGTNRAQSATIIFDDN